MRTTFFLAPAVILTAALVCGCGPNSSARAGGPADPAIQPVPPPAEMIGTWRHDVTDGTTTRKSVYQFMKDGRVVVDIQLDSPTVKVTDRVKRAVINVEKDRVTWVDLSHTSVDGVEDVLPPERRHAKTYQVQVKGDELRLSEVDEKGNPVPDATPRTLTRVKE